MIPCATANRLSLLHFQRAKETARDLRAAYADISIAARARPAGKIRRRAASHPRSLTIAARHESEGVYRGYPRIAGCNGANAPTATRVRWLSAHPCVGEGRHYGGSSRHAQLARRHQRPLVAHYMNRPGLSLFHEGYARRRDDTAALHQGGTVPRATLRTTRIAARVGRASRYDDSVATRTPRCTSKEETCHAAPSAWVDFHGGQASVASFNGRPDRRAGPGLPARAQFILGPWLPRRLPSEQDLDLLFQGTLVCDCTRTGPVGLPRPQVE